MAIQISGTTVIDNSRNIFNAANVGINTNSLSDANLVGAGNSLTGLYINDGMIVMGKYLTRNSYIGTAYNGLMAGPVTISGTLTVAGDFVVI